MCVTSKIKKQPYHQHLIYLISSSNPSYRLPFALASTINTLLWSVSGVIALKDSNIYIPNLLGLACSLAQLVVIFMYGSGEKRAAPSEMELPLTR